MSGGLARAWQAVVDAALQAIIEAPQAVRVIGVSGAQGSGKSTLSSLLADALTAHDISTAVVSLDDFYLTKQAREQLAAQVHPLCRTRGVPGTHDVGLLKQALQDAHNGADQFELPEFDKGLDDRRQIHQVQARCLLLEGWCVGVRHQPETQLSRPVNQLEQEEDPQMVWRRWVNQHIQQFYEPLWSAIDYWAFLKVPSFAQVYSWRAQQEQAIPAQLRMNEVQLNRFIEHYQRLTQWQLEQPFRHRPGLQVQLNEAHEVTAITSLK